MNNILQKIYQTKLEEIRKLPSSKSKLREWPVRSLSEALSTKGEIACIAEIKKASPSAGIIRNNFNPVLIAQEYEKLPVKAVSVLTDEGYFQGHLKYLIEIRKTLSKPILRKDFIIDTKQVYESYNNGADIILLIVSMLSEDQLKELYACAYELGLDVLIEVHDQNELEKALSLNPKIIGVNNRNLKTFKTDLNTSLKLSDLIPKNIIKVAESGLHSPEDIKVIQQKGFDAVLLGEVFMRSSNITETYNKLFNYG